MVKNSTFSGNITSNVAGAISTGNSTIENSMFSGNRGYVGAISSGGTLVVKNSTVSGNQGFLAGGIANSGALTVRNSTITANSASSPDGAGGIYTFPGGTLDIRRSVVTGNIPNDIIP